MAMWTGSLMHWFAAILAIVILLKALLWIFKPELGSKTAKWVTSKSWPKWAYLAIFLYFSWFMLFRSGLNIIQYTVTFLAVAGFYGYFFLMFPKQVNTIAKDIAKRKLEFWPMLLIMLIWGVWVLWYLFV